MTDGKLRNRIPLYFTALSALFDLPIEVPTILPTSSTEMEIPSIVLPDSSNFDPNYPQASRSAADISQERLWNELTSLYSANETMKVDAARLNPVSTSRDLTGDGDTEEKLDELLDSFINGANAVLEELTILGNAHPALAVAIFAFHEVVKLDIARRDNNKKVMVVILQMQSMLGPMFQLRNLNRSHMPEAERNFHEGRLSETVEYITRDIKQCRSDIMHFMNRKLVYKFVLAKAYEKKFASHMETFARRRAELQSVISEYIAIGVSTANVAISQVGAKVDNVDAKLDQIISTIFRNLDTTREKDVFKFIEQHGGPEKCVNDLNLLPKLVSKAGEAPKTGKTAISDPAELEELRTALSAALKEDLDKVLERHYSRFEKVLQVQSNNLKHMSAHLEDQGMLMQTHTVKLGKILNTVTTIMVLEEGKFQTKEVKLKDPEIHEVWTRMKLGTSSVKAKVFVLTFRDHIRAGNSTTATPIQSSIPLPTDKEESNMLLPAVPNTDTSSDDEWVFEYIDVAYVQPIVEAMDEDGSGFISVKEANSFALSRDRPKNMKLLSWIAYWAAGWHINLVKYQKKIYSILLQMHQELPSIHIANRTYMDDFLDETVMRRIEALCRSLKPLPNMTRRDPKLLAVADNVASWQLERLKTNLSAMGFVIETPFVATAVSGSSRVETWIFPTLYLLLQRYLNIVKLAKTVVLDKTEFESHVTSLMSVFSVFDERMENLEAKFSQLHKDVDAQFRTFSYGMFYAAHKKNELDTSLNTLLEQRIDEYSDQREAANKKGVPPDTSILSKPLGKGFEFADVNLLPASLPPPEHVAHPIEGNWFGWSAWTDSNHMRPHRCVIHPVIDNKLVGKGEAFFGEVDFIGTVSPAADPQTGKIRISFEFNPTQSDWRGQVCEGFYDPVRDTVEGTFEWKEDVPTEEVAVVDPTPEQNPEAIEATGPQEEPDAAKEIEPIAENAKDTDILSGTAPAIFHDSSKSDDDEEKEQDSNIDPQTDASASVQDVENRAAQRDDNFEVHLAYNTATGNEPTNEDMSNLLANTSASAVLPGEEELIQVKGTGDVEVTMEAENAEGGPKDETEEESEKPANDEAGETKEVPDRRFYLTRTPPHLFRFRTYLDGPGPAPCWGSWSLARKRWAFATEAILYETRRPEKAVTEALAERRRWLYLAIRYDMKDSSITQRTWRFDFFSDKEWDEYDALITSVQPDMARMWEETAHFMARRQTYIVGWLLCDLCSNYITFSRHQCIMCMKDDLSSSIDLCQNCFDKSERVTRSLSGNFAHLPTHSLLRSRSRVHTYEVNSLMPAARLTSERCKKMFRDLEEAKKEEKVARRTGKVVKGKGSRKAVVEISEGPPETVEPIACASCDKQVSLPCWVCLECSPLAFICMSCDRKNAPVKQREHSVLEHHLILIHDSIEVKTVKEAKGSEVERQLDDLNTSIMALDQKVNLQLDDVKLLVEDMAKTVGSKEYDLFSSVTSASVDWEEEQRAVPDDEVAKEEEETHKEEGELTEEDANQTSSPAEPMQINGFTEGEKPMAHSKAGQADKPAGSRTTPNLRDRLAILEKRVDSILTHLAQDEKHAALERKIDALEVKMDQKLGVLLTLMQNFSTAGGTHLVPDGTGA